jgi:MFS transporter, DHA2 family, multidrug resistance protein
VLLALVFSVFGVREGGAEAALVLASALAAASAAFSLLRLRGV